METLNKAECISDMESIGDTSNKFTEAYNLATGAIMFIDDAWTAKQKRDAYTGALMAIQYDMVDHEVSDEDTELINEYVQLSIDYIKGRI